MPHFIDSKIPLFIRCTIICIIKKEKSAAISNCKMQQIVRNVKIWREKCTLE